MQTVRIGPLLFSFLSPATLLTLSYEGFSCDFFRPQWSRRVNFSWCVECNVWFVAKRDYDDR